MRQWTVDAFAPQPFRGNPACVVEPFEAWPDAAWMQALAAENNQAETAFLLRTGDPGRFGLRWFTPAVEVDLCGHATLASSHALLAELGVDAAQLAFDTRSGELRVRRAGDGYEMDFPARKTSRIEAPAGLAEALGATPAEVWRGSFLIVVFADPAVVRGLTPDLGAVRAIADEVGVAALAGPGADHDVVDRFFAPGIGIPEDPATGAFHCELAPLFADRLGRSTLRFHQAYPGRGGELECEHRGQRVLLRGQAVTIAESRLRVAP